MPAKPYEYLLSRFVTTHVCPDVYTQPASRGPSLVIVVSLLSLQGVQKVQYQALRVCALSTQASWKFKLRRSSTCPLA
jgi:hypothetical protein